MQLLCHNDAKITEFWAKSGSNRVKFVSNSRIKVDRDLILLPNDRYGVLVVI